MKTSKQLITAAPVLHLGNNLEVIKQYKDQSFHAVVTDAPYGLNNKEHDVQELAKKFLQGKNYVLGGKGIDNHEWDSDLPTLDLAKEIFRVLKPGGFLVCFSSTRTYDILGFTLRWAGFKIKDQLIWTYASGVPKGQWLEKKTADSTFEGLNTCLKPAVEPIVLAQKPLAEGEDHISNFRNYGTGALNIGAVQVIRSDGEIRYPANIITDGSTVVNAGFNAGNENFNACPEGLFDHLFNPVLYYSKAQDKEKDFGLDQYITSKTRKALFSGRERAIKNIHPTVKPIALMRHLVRLVSRPGDIVADLFLGSGSTGIASVLEGRNFVGMEINEDYFECADIRIRRAKELMDKYKTNDHEQLALIVELETLKVELAHTASLLTKDPKNTQVAKYLIKLDETKRAKIRKLKELRTAA